MRNYSITTSNKWHVIYNYITQLDQQVGNFYDYIKEYHPNYQILNTKPNYYTEAELGLEKLNICNSQTSKINISSLNRHQAIINNYHRPYLLDFQSNIAPSYIIISPNNEYINLRPQVEAINLDTTEQKLNIYSYEGFPEYQLKGFEGYIALSEVKSNTGNNTSIERYNPANYIIGRVAAPATYYILDSIQRFQDDTQYKGSYRQNAEWQYGIHQYYSFLPIGSNFYYYDFYNDHSQHRMSKTIFYKDIVLNDSQNYTYGTNYYLLNHTIINENVINDISVIEEIIMDDTAETNVFLDNDTAIPYYKIMIPNIDNESFIYEYPIKIRLG